MTITAFWILFSIIIGIGASARGRSGWGFFFLALTLSPLLAFLLLILMPAKETPAEEPAPAAAPAAPAARARITGDVIAEPSPHLTEEQIETLAKQFGTSPAYVRGNAASYASWFEYR